MKLRLFNIILLMLAAVSLQAQSDYSSYLDKALQQLEAKNCDAAQKLYNVYKELTGDSKPAVEALIADCQPDPDKPYKLGDQMTVGDKVYTVAYVRDGGKHGLAVFNEGWTYIRPEDRTMKTIPTFEELELIYQNRDQVRLYDIYWSCTLGKVSSDDYYKVKDFSTGKVRVVYYNRNREAMKLRIHRF